MFSGCEWRPPFVTGIPRCCGSEVEEDMHMVRRGDSGFNPWRLEMLFCGVCRGVRGVDTGLPSRDS